MTHIPISLCVPQTQVRLILVLPMSISQPSSCEILLRDTVMPIAISNKNLHKMFPSYVYIYFWSIVLFNCMLNWCKLKSFERRNLILENVPSRLPCGKAHRAFSSLTPDMGGHSLLWMKFLTSHWNKSKWQIIYHRKILPSELKRK